MESEASWKFIADSNVGRLARWLRLLGYDTSFSKDLDDDGILRVALAEGRLVLTRDTHFLRRHLTTSGHVKVLLLRDDRVREQLRQAVQELGLDWRSGRFSRCLECNQPLEERDKEEVRSLVPPYVYKTQKEFARCPDCRRIYWQGTHWQRMQRELEALEMGEG
ncbi:MAG: Mut7-C RNAse domain-containing protein [Chloroflexi bacterium]|nr:Mut7-C RNAse domain-containing protein [Chloroflexota bacterium]